MPRPRREEDEPNLVYILHIEARAYWKTKGFSNAGFGEPKLADVKKKRANFRRHVAKKFGIVEHLCKVVNGRGGRVLGVIDPSKSESDPVSDSLSGSVSDSVYASVCES